ncbi:MAG: WG repeat-containing protein [Faecalibacterium sp.]
MKNYARFFPWVIVAVFALSIYSLASMRLSNTDEYLSQLAQAREYSANGLLVDARAAYDEILDDYPSIETAIEVGEMYIAYDDYTTATTWGKKILLKEYPTDSETYEFVIQVAIATGNYSLAFTTYAECVSREVVSDQVELLMQDIWYVYNLNNSFEEVGIYSNTQGYVAVAQDGKWGYADTTGQLKVAYQYESAGVFSDGMAPIVDETGEAYYIDTSGNKKFVSSYIVTEDSGLLMQDFSMMLNDIIVGYDGAYWNYYKVSSREQFLGGYLGATLFNGGVAAVTYDGTTWMLINSQGEQVGTDTYEEVLTDTKNVACRSTALIVKMNGSYYLVNQMGEKITETAYLDAVGFNESSYAAVKKSTGWVYVDAAGVEQDFGTYEQAQSFSNGLAAVMVDGLWGYIDTTGTLAIPAIFDDATIFSAFGSSFVKEQGDDEWSLLRLISEMYL